MTPPADALRALRERVEGLTGPDREVDALIHAALFPDQQVMLDPGSMHPKAEPKWGTLRALDLAKGWKDWEGLAAIMQAKPVTASIDDSVALIAQVLPDIWMDVVRDAVLDVIASRHATYPPTVPSVDSLARMILRRGLRALEAQAGRSG